MTPAAASAPGHGQTPFPGPPLRQTPPEQPSGHPPLQDAPGHRMEPDNRHPPNPTPASPRFDILAPEEKDARGARRDMR